LSDETDLLISLGPDTYVTKDRIQAVFSPENAAMKKMKTVADQERKVVNLTYGNETKSILLMDSGHVLLTMIEVEQLLKEYEKGKTV